MNDVYEEIRTLEKENTKLWHQMRDQTWLVIICHVVVFTLTFWFIHSYTSWNMSIILEAVISLVVTELVWLLVVPLRYMWINSVKENWKKINENQERIYELKRGQMNT